MSSRFDEQAAEFRALRRKLEAVGWNAIRTVRGQGYICVTDA